MRKLSFMPKVLVVLALLFSSVPVTAQNAAPAPAERGAAAYHSIVHSTPVEVAGITSGATAVGAGWEHTCALVSGGVKCWGSNEYGQLGNWSRTASNIPVNVLTLTSGVTAIAIGNFHSCALTSGGGVKCWGSNNYGSLGDSTHTDNLGAGNVISLTSGVAAITAGGDHTCALTTGGGVKCWGRNTYGELGDGTTLTRYTPVNVLGLTSGVAAIAGGDKHTCAITTGGAVKCWGYNYYGQLGNGTNTNSNVPVDVHFLTSHVVAIAGGFFHTCGTVSNAGATNTYCWGENVYGELGNGNNNWMNEPALTWFSGSPVKLAITAGTHHACALTSGSGGETKCWGWNTYGQIGDGTTTHRNVPTDVISVTSGMAAIHAGYGHTCAATTGGAVKCWGDNGYGQLGYVEPVFTISGQVIDPDSQGVGGVVISADAGLTTTTNASGYYTLTGLLTGSYSITPTLGGYVFNPISTSVTVPPDTTGRNFTGVPVYSVSGQVTDDQSAPLAGVSIASSSGVTRITNGSGYYTFTNVMSGTYMLTPTLAGYTFAPLTATVSVPPEASGLAFIGTSDEKFVYLPLVSQ